jgi:hypothetical protein
MEFSIKMLAVIVIVLVVLVVCIALITNWGGQANSSVNGLMNFFNSILSGKPSATPTLPSVPGK